MFLMSDLEVFREVDEDYRRERMIAFWRRYGTVLLAAAVVVMLIAYAQGDPDQASNARRLSLSRALAVRSFLIDQGVHSSRIEVRALGNKVTDGPPDRVDLVVQKH